MRRALRRPATAILAVGTLAFAAACGGSSSGGGGTAGQGGNSSEPTQGQVKVSGAAANTVNSGTPKQGGKLTYVLEKDITDWNINTSVGNTFETAEVMDGIEPQVFVPQPDTSSVALNTDMMVSADQTSTSPQTIVYKIQPNASWSDGQPISADDFIYFWKAQNGSCAKCDINSTTGWDSIKSITGSDNGKTVTVVFKKTFSDWQALFGAGYGLLPSHLVKGMSQAAGWNTFFNKQPTWSGGPYKLQSFQSNKAAVLVPNPSYYGAKPKLDQLIFQIITDATQEPTALQNHEVDAIYPQPEVDLLSQIKSIPNVKYQLDLGLTYEHFDFNLNNPFLKDKALRQALFTAVNVKDIIAKTVGQFDPDVKPLGNRIILPQQQGYEDHVTSLGLGTGDIAKAKQILTSAGYKLQGSSLIDPQGKKVPAFRMRYTVGNAIRQDECNLFKAAAAQLGVTVNVQSTDSLGGSLTHADPQHDYDIIVFAWVGNPFFVSSNVDIYRTGGGGNYGKYSNPQVDQLLNAALGSTDKATQIKDVNQADMLVSQDAYTLPLYQKPTFLAYYNNLVNVRDNATGVGPPYNDGQWGVKATT